MYSSDPEKIIIIFEVLLDFFNCNSLNTQTSNTERCVGNRYYNIPLVVHRDTQNTKDSYMIFAGIFPSTCKINVSELKLKGRLLLRSVTCVETNAYSLPSVIEVARLISKLILTYRPPHRPPH